MSRRLITAAALVTCACGTPNPPPPTPVAPSPTIALIAIADFPSTIAVGDTVQLRAVGVLSNGSTKDLPDVTWQSTNPQIARVSETGVLEALGAGFVTITAIYQGTAASGRVSVLPRVPPAPMPTPHMTYTIHGVVRESGPHQDAMVAGASVTIADGWDAGRSVTTDANGAFTFSNVEATYGFGFPLRVSKAGYRDASYRILTLPRDERADVSLSRVAGCAYAVEPAGLKSWDYVRSGSFDVVTAAGCAWTAALIATPAPGASGLFRFTSSPSGTGSGRVLYSAFSSYGYEPYAYTVRVEGPNGGSAIYVVSVAGR